MNAIEKEIKALEISIPKKDGAEKAKAEAQLASLKEFAADPLYDAANRDAAYEASGHIVAHAKTL
jgi:hypothetical protein